MAKAKKAARRKRGNGQITQAEQSEWDAFFPFKDVKLQSGQMVVVKQWDIDTGAILTGRVVQLLQKLQAEGIAGSVELPTLLRVAKDECLQIVAETIGWSVPQLKKQATWEDFMSLLQAVIDTCLVREDGAAGALPKVVELAGSLGPIVGAMGGTE